VSDGFRSHSAEFPRMLMGFPRVLYSFRGNSYNNPGVFISTPRFPSDVDACPSETLEKHAAISAIHRDRMDCPAERLGIPSGLQQRSWSRPGFRAICADFRVETGPVRHAAAGIPADPQRVRMERPDFACENERCTACTSVLRVFPCVSNCCLAWCALRRPAVRRATR
jgi:hypothetical protein